jgi:hypothetical protein
MDKSDEHYKLIQNHLYEDIYENGDPLVLLISRILMARLLCQEMYLEKSIDAGWGFRKPKKLSCWFNKLT